VGAFLKPTAGRGVGVPKILDFNTGAERDARGGGKLFIENHDLGSRHGSKARPEGGPGSKKARAGI